MKPTVVPDSDARLTINAAGEIEVNGWTVDLHEAPLGLRASVRAIVEWALEKSLPEEVDTAFTSRHVVHIIDLPHPYTGLGISSGGEMVVFSGDSGYDFTPKPPAR